VFLGDEALDVSELTIVPLWVLVDFWGHVLDGHVKRVHLLYVLAANHLRHLGPIRWHRIHLFDVVNCPALNLPEPTRILHVKLELLVSWHTWLLEACVPEVIIVPTWLVALSEIYLLVEVERFVSTLVYNSISSVPGLTDIHIIIYKFYSFI
jgi:hypothetical protein